MWDLGEKKNLMNWELLLTKSKAQLKPTIIITITIIIFFFFF